MENLEKQESNQPHKATAWDSLRNIPFAGAIQNKYEQSQRPIREEIKQALSSGEKHRYEVESQISEHSLDLSGLDRSALGRAKQLVATSSLWRHINPRGYEKALGIRQAEAAKVALDEYEIEQEKAAEMQRLQKEAEKARKEAERKQQLVAYEAERARTRQEREDNEFIGAANTLKNDHRERFIGAKVQELTERAFNEKLTSIEEIAAHAEAGEGASVETLEYDGREIPVYHVNQLPIKFLQTTINYKEANRGTPFGKHGIGFKSMENLVENPSFWENDISVMKDFENKSNDERLANTISASYVDEEYSDYGAVDFSVSGEELPISYAFTRIQPDSLVYARGADVASGQSMGDRQPKSSDFASVDPDKFIIDSRNGYNELVLRRYDLTTGKLLYRPDFIRTKNGQISEGMLKHAAYFNIPIVDINQNELNQVREAHLIDELSHLDENSSYEDIARGAQLIYKHNSALMQYNYGDEIDKNSQLYAHHYGQVHPEMMRVLELDHAKMLDYAEAQIHSAIESLRKGEKRHDTLDDSLTIDSAEQYQDQTARLTFEVGKGSSFGRREITIKDGANTPAEKRLGGNTYDSSAYNRFKPLLEDLRQAQNS